MSGTDRFHCLYCKNPRPDISYSALKNEGYAVTSPSIPILPSASISGNETANINKTPKIKCDYCNREYLLFGTKKERGFFQHNLKNLKMHQSLLGEMSARDLTVENIIKGYIGITRLLLQYFIIYHRDQFHILFEAEGNVYYLVCKRVNGKMIAVQLMEAN